MHIQYVHWNSGNAHEALQDLCADGECSALRGKQQRRREAG